MLGCRFGSVLVVTLAKETSLPALKTAVHSALSCYLPADFAPAPVSLPLALSVCLSVTSQCSHWHCLSVCLSVTSRCSHWHCLSVCLSQVGVLVKTALSCYLPTDFAPAPVSLSLALSVCLSQVSHTVCHWPYVCLSQVGVVVILSVIGTVCLARSVF